jgi:bacteriocin biosynthesis cyclodehydratase domain-containing protein
VSESTALAELGRYASTPLPKRPLLVPWVEPVEVGEGLLELRAAETFYPLRHPLLAAAFRAVESRLAGELDVESIAADLPAPLEPGAVTFLLKMLQAIGLLLDGEELAGADGPARDRLLFLSTFTSRPAAVERRIAAAAVQVVGPERLAERVTHQLRALGCERVAWLQVSDLGQSEAADLLIACAGTPARNYFSRLNSVALRSRRPWLRAAVHGNRAWLGPLVLPGETACFACLETREQANVRGSGTWPELEPGAAGAFAPQEDLLAAQAAAEAARFLGRFAPPATVGHFYELSAASPDTRRHPLLRVPGCPACGALWATEEAP